MIRIPRWVATTLLATALVAACVPVNGAGTIGRNDGGQTIALGRGGITLSGEMQAVPLSSARTASARIGVAEIEVLPPRARTGPADAREPFAILRADVLEGGDAYPWVLDAATLVMELVGPTGLAIDLGDLSFDAIVTLTFDHGADPITGRYRLSFTRVD